jgi:clan AA aspartic protease
MIGTVDNSGRALLRIRLQHPSSSTELELDAWIDTGFTGELVLPLDRVVQFKLPLGPAIRAALADGSEVDLNAYTCLLDWFGEWKQIEVIANEGQFPLLGVGLLLDHELHIDYQSKTLSVT